MPEQFAFPLEAREILASREGDFAQARWLRGPFSGKIPRRRWVKSPDGQAAELSFSRQPNFLLEGFHPPVFARGRAAGRRRRARPSRRRERGLQAQAATPRLKCAPFLEVRTQAVQSCERARRQRFSLACVRAAA